MIKVASVFGTRPEVIKLAPVIAAFEARPEVFRAITIATAQHRELMDQMIDVFALRIDHDLGLMSPDQTLPELAGALIEHISRVLAAEKPDVVVVQGDTATVFAAALAAFYQRIPVAHVEAGLRTDDKYFPFPEEANRRLATVLADLHFAPTAGARDNLLREGVPADRIFVTGNTIVDALEIVRSRAARREGPIGGFLPNGERLLLLTAHRRESHGERLADICRAIRRIVDRHRDVVVAFPVHLSPHVQKTTREILGGVERVCLMSPLDYLEFVRLMECSYLILTDSGGIQEEAPSMGKPVLVLRHETERAEAVDAGTARLVGTNPDRIVEAVEDLLTNRAAYDRMTPKHNPFGDGTAGRRIAEILGSWMARASA